MPKKGWTSLSCSSIVVSPSSWSGVSTSMGSPPSVLYLLYLKVLSSLSLIASPSPCSSGGKLSVDFWIGSGLSGDAGVFSL